MDIRFDNKIVAVTGAGIGIGREIATRFAALGAAVYGCDIDPAGLEDTARAGVHTDVVDLRDRDAATAWVRSVETRAGRALDVLVNNAGGVAGQSSQPIETVADADWDRVIDINLGATFAVSRAAVPAMKAARAGAIVNISSGAALARSLTGVQAYCSAKHAVLGLTRQLAHELGPHGIRVNSVAPGLIITNAATQRQWAAYGAEKQRALLDGIAMRRLGRADEIANAVLFLASELASFVNGQVLSVNGGQ